MNWSIPQFANNTKPTKTTFFLNGKVARSCNLVATIMSTFPTMLQALVTEITLLAHDTPNDPGLITIQTSGY